MRIGSYLRSLCNCEVSRRKNHQRRETQKGGAQETKDTGGNHRDEEHRRDERHRRRPTNTHKGETSTHRGNHGEETYSAQN